MEMLFSGEESQSIAVCATSVSASLTTTANGSTTALEAATTGIDTVYWWTLT